MGLHNPLPSSVKSECKKCGKILASFVNPNQVFGPDKVIPTSILSNAKGLAVVTILKAGFLGSGRLGSGIVVARLPDGAWSAPSAIALGGAGFGGQIGLELADFVFVLNDAHAVKTFAQAGSLTLGGNVSLAAGPVGRNAEAAGAASLRSVTGIFSYSKTRGLFAGISLEGSAIIERRDANEQLYGSRYAAQQILSGVVRPPPEAQSLMAVLNSRAISGPAGAAGAEDTMYNDAPVYASEHDSVVWQDDFYDRPPAVPTLHAPSRASTFSAADSSDGHRYGDSPSPAGAANFGAPARPQAPKPNFGSKQAFLQKNEAVALYNFEPDQPGDLGFKKGEVIMVLKKTESDNDWWTGMIGSRRGIFPSNYVKMKE